MGHAILRAYRNTPHQSINNCICYLGLIVDHLQGISGTILNQALQTTEEN